MKFNYIHKEMDEKIYIAFGQEFELGVFRQPLMTTEQLIASQTHDNKRNRNAR